MNIMPSQNFIPKKDERDPYSWSTLEVESEQFKSTGTFYRVLRNKPSYIGFGQEPINIVVLSSGEIFEEKREYFLQSIPVKDSQKEIIQKHQAEQIKDILGTNLSETAEILQVKRQTIYDWKANRVRPTPKNQDRLNKLISICKNWENLGLGQIRHLIRQNISNDFSLFDLLCRDELDEHEVYRYFDKLKTYITSLNKEKTKRKTTDVKSLSDKAAAEKLIMHSRKIG